MTRATYNWISGPYSIPMKLYTRPENMNTCKQYKSIKRNENWLVLRASKIKLCNWKPKVFEWIVTKLSKINQHLISGWKQQQKNQLQGKYYILIDIWMLMSIWYPTKYTPKKNNQGRCEKKNEKNHPDSSRNEMWMIIESEKHAIYLCTYWHLNRMLCHLTTV